MVIFLEEKMAIDKKKLLEFKEKRKVNKEAMKAMINSAVDYDALLNKYGPEGLYMIADKLKEVANCDMALGIDQAIKNFK